MPTKTKTYKGRKRTRTVTKKKVGKTTIKDVVVRKKGTKGKTGVIKKKNVVKTKWGRDKLKEKKGSLKKIKYTKNPLSRFKRKK
tara:strand:- start:1967 stop:2218 length:252 start_codon:yes stop_codon:yes gene_type:complete